MRRNQTARRLFRVLVLLSTGVALGSRMAFGFVVEDNYDIWNAPRWSNVPGSFLEHRVRGLGGGLEYAIAGDLCDKVLPVILDDPKPSCEQLQEIIHRAFHKWTVGHPILKFTNITGKIRPERPSEGRSGINLGAEIDIFAAPSPATGWTQFWSERKSPLGTNNQVLSGHTITTADILIHPGRCFFLDPALKDQRMGPWRCSHFESLLMHEIGHVLGLDHPTEFRDLNYDTDSDPFNEIPIDCEDPTNGLRKSPNIDPFAIMSYWPSDPEEFGKLTNDDLGGRNFLYPICPGTSADAVSADWARGQVRPVSGD